MVELTLRWFDFAAIGGALVFWTLAVLLGGAYLDATIQLRSERRHHRKQRDQWGRDAMEQWLEVVEPNGWAGLAPEEGETA